ncbi:uncharacterized protein LOC112046561 [Bicyclus anynana]|uniref:protein-tyrosine-phosphatase n=1 Tax=Bicyclus anynana TaxID=110368 RepID=A0A6J1MWQ9_BICAN|nr:uncharacterized protein LOC112046561 [Bicyclus anynana]
MICLRDIITVMLRSVFLVAFFNIPRPVISLTGFKSWSRKVLYEKIDLCTQCCYSEILPGLYLSNAKAAGDRDVLKQLKITHILTVETRRLPKSTFTDNDISYLFIRAHDLPSTNLLSYFPMANSFIAEGRQKGNVLVHCHFGVSRSATMVIAYVMEKYKMTYDRAFHFVRQKRKFINPNPGFVAQLKEYHKLNYKVDGFQKFEAFMNVKTRKHRYKIASIAAVVIGVLLPLALLGG